MADWVPKFSDVKNLQDLAKVLVLPMVMASWILQSGMQLSIPDSEWVLRVPEQAAQGVQMITFIVIFLGKGIFAAFWAWVIYMVPLFLMPVQIARRSVDLGSNRRYPGDRTD